MLQYYEMVFWRKPESENTSFDEIAEKAYKAVSVFQKMPEKYRPTFPVGKNKKDTVFEELTYEKFYNELRKNINQADGVIYKDLGYRIKLFTSFDSSTCCVYSFGIGKTNQKFINAFVVEFALDLDYFNPDISNLLSNIFVEVVKIFKPFWACAVNSLLPVEQLYLTEDNHKPTALHWLNYFSPKMTNNLGGEKRFKKVQKKFKSIKFIDGVLQLQDIALDANRPEDVKLKTDIEKELL